MSGNWMQIKFFINIFSWSFPVIFMFAVKLFSFLIACYNQDVISNLWDNHRSKPIIDKKIITKKSKHTARTLKHNVDREKRNIKIQKLCDIMAVLTISQE